MFVNANMQYVPVDPQLMKVFIDKLTPLVKKQDDWAEVGGQHDPSTLGFLVHLKNGKGRIDTYSIHDVGYGPTWMVVKYA